MLWWTLRKLRSTDPATRRQAIDALGANASPDAIAALIEALADSSATVADRAAEVLGRFGDAAADPLTACLRSASNFEVRRRALTALARAGSSKAVAAVIAALADTSSRVCEQAVSALTACPNEAAVPALLEAANSLPPAEVDKALRACATEASIGVLAASLGARASWTRRRAVRALAELTSDQASDALVAALADSEYLVCEPAAEALAARRYEPARGGLLRMLADGNSSKRAVAARSLTAFVGSDSDDALARALRDVDIDVRETAAATLRERKWAPRAKDDRAWYFVARRSWGSAAELGADATPALIAAIESGVDRQPDAIRALGRTGDARAFDVLVRCAASKDWEIRKAAAHALGNMEDGRVADVLESLLRDEHHTQPPPSKRGTPAAAWGMPAEPENHHWSDPMSAYPVRQAALDSLVRLRHARTAGILIAWAVDSREDAEPAVAALRRVMREFSQQVAAEDLERIAGLPRLYRSEARSAGYRDPEGGESGVERYGVELACEDLRTAAREELERRRADRVAPAG